LNHGSLLARSRCDNDKYPRNGGILSRARNILINTSSLTFASLLTRVFSLPLNAWLVRILEPEAFGQYSYLLSFCALFSPLIVLGFPSFLCREVVQQPQKIGVFLTSSYLLMALSSIILLPIIFFTGGQNWLLFVASIGMFLSSSATLLQLAIIGLNRSYLTAIAQVVVSLFTSLGTFVLILSHPQLEQLIWLSTFSSLLQHISYYVIAKMYCPELIFAKRWPTLKEHWELFSKSMPYIFLVVFSTIYFRIDITLLEHWSTLSEVAGYSAAYKFIEISALLVSIAGQVFFAEFSNMFARQEEGAEQVLQRGFYLMVLMGLPLATCLFFYAKDVLYVFYGSKYLQEIGTLQVLAWTTVFLFARMLPGMFFQANNQVRVQSIVYGISTAINISLNYVLIPSLGGFGAGISTLICEIFNLLGFSYFLKKNMNIQVLGSGLLPALSGFACMSGTLFAVQTLPAIAGIVIGLFSFLGGFSFAGGLKTTEFNFLKTLLTRVRR
jgi:O-antigen/teichoic acid export membrane protein